MSTGPGAESLEIESLSPLLVNPVSEGTLWIYLSVSLEGWGVHLACGQSREKRLPLLFHLEMLRSYIESHLLFVQAGGEATTESPTKIHHCVSHLWLLSILLEPLTDLKPWLWYKYSFTQVSGVPSKEISRMAEVEIPRCFPPLRLWAYPCSLQTVLGWGCSSVGKVLA